MPAKKPHEDNDIVGFSSKLPFSLIKKFRALSMEMNKDQTEMLKEAVEQYIAKHGKKH